MPAANYNITIEQGASFSRTLTLKDSSGIPINLTGWTIRGQIRASQNASSALATFTGTVANQGTNPGEATISLTPTQTAAIPQNPDATTAQAKTINYLYDIEGLRPDTSVVRLLQGKVTLSPEITK
jgi:hypothetical protein